MNRKDYKSGSHQFYCLIRIHGSVRINSGRQNQCWRIWCQEPEYQHQDQPGNFKMGAMEIRRFYNKPELVFSV